MKVLIDNSNNDAVYIAPEIEYSANIAVARNNQADIILILGDMTPANSRIEITEEVPEDFCGRNYSFTEGVLIKKLPGLN